MEGVIMDTAGLIAALSSPAAYPYPVDDIQLCQTHISLVFLAGDCAYKVKKSVHLDFLDFSTLELRRHFCDEEVRLNQRLAPSVYHGVVPVTRVGDQLTFEGTGEVIEWAVKMERLPEEATLRHRLGEDTVEVTHLQVLARRIAEFHRNAKRGPAISAYARTQAIARNTRENLDDAKSRMASLISPVVHERLRQRMDQVLADLGSLMEARAEHGVPCDTHGDLRLDHVYLFPERKTPDDLVIVDCVEFAERFRYADPVADMAFLVMDLQAQGRRDLARIFAHAYFDASGDAEGHALLSFYTAYRSAVRAKVDGLKAEAPEVPAAEREEARDKGRYHWLRALIELEEPGRKPCVLLLAGLPGTGKSTLAAALAKQAGFTAVRSDVVRKEIVGSRTDWYSSDWSQRTYEECLRRAEALILDGQRVLIDANFRKEAQRSLFFTALVRRGVPAGLLICETEPEVVRTRLAQRRNDASDANWDVYLRLRADWEEPGLDWLPCLRKIETSGASQEAVSRAVQALQDMGLHTPP